MINMHKIILYILIGFGVASCSTPTTIEEAETQPAAETIVSKGFIGQTFSNNSTDSFGQTKQEFSFEKNGVGTYYVAWTISSTLHEDLGDMSWEINEGKIHVHYTYKSSDGITSSEEDVFTYNKQRNELISTSNNSKVFKAVHSNSGSKQNDKAHEFSKKLSGISDDNQSFKDKTYFIQTDYSYIENNGNIKKQNNKIISWSFEVTNDLVKILMMVDKEHNFTGHYISNSQLEMRKSDGRKYCIFEISNNELLQVFTSGDTWHHQIQNRRQEGGDSYDEAEYNRQQEQAEYESSQAYYNSENEKENLATKSKIKEKVKLNQTQWQYYFIGEFESGLPVYAIFTREGNRIYGKYLWCTISEAISIDGEITTDNHFILQDASGNKFSGILKGESMSGKWVNSKYENTLKIRATTDNDEKSRTSKIVNSNQGCYTE